MITIDNLTFTDSEIDLSTLSKTVAAQPNQPLELGINKSFYPIKVVADLPIYQYGVDLFLTELNYKKLLQKYINQKYTKLSGYYPDGVTTPLVAICYPFSSTLSNQIGTSYCFISEVEKRGPSFKDGVLNFNCRLSFFEIQINDWRH